MVGLTWGPGDPFHPSLRWAPLLSHLLERQKMIGRDFEEDSVLCFDKLVLGRSQSLDWCGSWVHLSLVQHRFKVNAWCAANGGGCKPHHGRNLRRVVLLTWHSEGIRRCLFSELIIYHLTSVVGCERMLSLMHV